MVLHSLEEIRFLLSNFIISARTSFHIRFEKLLKLLLFSFFNSLLHYLNSLLLDLCISIQFWTQLIGFSVWNVFSFMNVFVQLLFLKIKFLSTPLISLFLNEFVSSLKLLFIILHNFFESLWRKLLFMIFLLIPNFQKWLSVG